MFADRSAHSRPLIVNTAFTGAVSDKRRNPAVPYTAEEVAEDLRTCMGHGASMGHFHVRGDQGEATNDPDRYAALFDRIRSQPDTASVIAVASTSGRHGQTREERAAVLRLPRDLRPDMASLTLSSLNFPGGASINQPDDIRFLAAEMREHGVRPELEVFDLGMISFAEKLIDEDLIEPPFYFNVIFGNVAGMQATPASIAAVLAQLPDQSVVCFGGIGKVQMPAHLYALAGADGVRTGLEDNIWADANRTPATNGGLVAKIEGLASLAGRPVAGTEAVRARLGLPLAIV